ncbi:hypothetical protein [Citreimonas sp.]|uniref:hypothetical protein n=1 Tax=Citreimonas sp. TaxID=3036715 RepID=UPI0035C80930
MNFLPDPDPVVLAFFFIRKFVYLEVLAVLALTRVIVGGGLSRWPALVALALCLGGILTTFAPALGLTGTPLYAWSARAMAGGGGMAALLLPSVLMAISAVLPGARWKWLDLVHAAMLAGLLGLAWWTA